MVKQLAKGNEVSRF